MQPDFTDPESLDAHLLRNFGSHERSAVLLEWHDDGYLTDPAVLALVLAGVWIGRNERMPGDLKQKDWLRLFVAASLPSGDPVSDGAAVPALPCRIFRGGHRRGMAWTLDVQVARQFAAWCHAPVWEAVVEAHGDILAVFDVRQEREVVLRPHGDYVRTITQLR